MSQYKNEQIKIAYFHRLNVLHLRGDDGFRGRGMPGSKARLWARGSSRSLSGGSLSFIWRLSISVRRSSALTAPFRTCIHISFSIRRHRELGELSDVPHIFAWLYGDRKSLLGDRPFLEVGRKGIGARCTLIPCVFRRALHGAPAREVSGRLHRITPKHHA